MRGLGEGTLLQGHSIQKQTKKPFLMQASINQQSSMIARSSVDKGSPVLQSSHNSPFYLKQRYKQGSVAQQGNTVSVNNLDMLDFAGTTIPFPATLNGSFRIKHEKL